MSLDFTNAEQHMIGQMSRASSTLPDEYWCVAAMQELACLTARIEPLLTREQLATLIGVGALLIRQGKSEFVAEIEAGMHLARIAKGVA